MPEPSSIHRADPVTEPTSILLPIDAIRDRVIRVALSSGLLRASELAGHWTNYSALPEGKRPTRFWRFVADVHGVDREGFYALAAHAYGFREVEISVFDLIRFVSEIRSSFPDQAWGRMNELRVLPIARVTSADSVTGRDGRIVFASSDPTSLEVNNYLSTLPINSFELKYAASRSVDYVLDRVLPAVLSTVRKEGRATKTGPVPLKLLRDLNGHRSPGSEQAA